MKILFLIYSLGSGGAERVTSGLANLMASEGHEVAIAMMDGQVESPYRLDPQVRCIDLGLAGDSSNALHAASHLKQRVTAINRLLKNEGPALAIGMMATSATLLGLARHPTGTVVVGSERLYPPALPMSAMWKLLRKLAYRRLDCVVAQTGETREWLLKNTLARNVAVIGNPVSRLPEIAPSVSPEDVVGDDAKLVISVGRLADQKRFEHLIEAFETARAGKSDWHLAILGEGPLRASLEAQVEAAHAGDRIHLPGHVGNPREWLERADLFAMSSISEGMPNAMMEAMAHGLPAVSYDFKTGPRDLIDDGDNGLLVPDGDKAALAKALGSLMGNSELAGRMGQSAQAILKRFDPNIVADQWLALAVTKPARTRS